MPLLDFGRERESVDLSKVVLTHHNLKNKGAQSLVLAGSGDAPTLKPLTETGSGQVQDKVKAFLAEIIERVSNLFQGDLTDDDRLIYVNNVLKGKLLESETLKEQAKSNSKEQLASSPDLADAILHAIMDALDAHTTMSAQALDAEKVREGLKDILLGPGQLWEALRDEQEMPEGPLP